MSESEIYDYVDTVTPDYNATLSVISQVSITERGLKNQLVHLGDDGSEERISLSNDSIFYLDVMWPLRSESDIGTVMDWFHDSNKANGIVRTFKWIHYGEPLARRHTYVVRFNGDLARTIRMPAFFGIPQMTLKVIGRIAD